MLDNRQKLETVRIWLYWQCPRCQHPLLTINGTIYPLSVSQSAHLGQKQKFSGVFAKAAWIFIAFTLFLLVHGTLLFICHCLLHYFSFNLLIKSVSLKIKPLHRGAFCQFTFWWIYYCHSSKSTRKEAGKTYVCALCPRSKWNMGEILAFLA